MSRRLQDRAAQVRREELPDPVREAPEWEFRLPARLEAVPVARHAAMRACLSAGASEDDCFALDLALGEALANAVVHGLPEGGADITLHLWSYHDRLIVEVHDHGPGFDPPAPPYPMPDDHGATHGRGLPLMQHLTDALLVSRGDAMSGGATVYLVKALTGR